MCGIVAYVYGKSGGFNRKHEEIFQNMLYADAVRGRDATGVIAVMNDGDFAVAKAAMDAADFLGYNYYLSETAKALYAKGIAAIGHNRAKTLGKNTDENAHPFVIDKTFAMVHNGTLRNHHKLASTEVDSEALATVIKKAMDEEDWKSALEETMSRVEGAYAVMWYDQKRDWVCALRNKERPLALIETDDGVVLCSEVGLGHWMAGRHGSKIKKYDAVPEHTLVIFDMKKGGASFDQIPLTLKPHVTGFTNGVVTAATTGTIKTPVKKTIPKKGGQADVSKNQFKRFRNSLINKKIFFEADDWVEAELFGPGATDKVIVLGESKNGSYDLCEWKHIVKTTVSLSALQMDEQEMAGVLNWTGTIKNVEFNAKQKSIEVYLTDATPATILVLH